MAWVYIIKSDASDRYYIGSTNDLSQRIERHNKGLVVSTKSFIPWKLVFKQKFDTFGLARKSEIRIKKLKRRDYIERIIQDGILKSSVGPDVL